MSTTQELLGQKGGEVKRPTPLPIGTYVFMVKSHNFGESARKKTPYVEFVVIPTEIQEDVDQTQVQAKKEEGKSLVQIAYPSALGAKLPPKVGRYFNNTLLFELQGSRRIISTQAREGFQLKCAMPSLPHQIPIGQGTGLWDVFNAWNPAIGEACAARQ